MSVPLLRAWERRYGIVEPQRTTSGYRLYDDDAVARLRAMRRLVDEGWTASEAARAVLAGEVEIDTESVPRVAAADDRAPAPTASGSSARGGADAFVDRFVTAAARMDLGTLESALDDAFALGSFERVAETAVLPALRALGEAWQTGTVDVAGEHAASHAVLRRLGAAFEAAGRSSDVVGGIVVGLPPGSRHELGALTFATVARRSGLPVLYLGADVPASSWAEAARAVRARAAVVAVPTPADRRAAEVVLDGLHGLDGLVPGFVRAVGGGGAEAVNAPDDVVRLPATVADAAAMLRERLDGSR